MLADLKFYTFLGSQAVATLVLLVLLALWPGPWNTQRMVGSALLVIGMAFVFTARLQLGQSFSVIPRAKKLVTHGLYSKIRNPIYVFGTIAIAGMFLILQIPRLWVLLLVLVLIQVFRARKEAGVLEAKFGDDYRAYRSQTWF
jgi:protein-S-isoprenylcysteine O-methyltransferase Ste14